MSSVRVAAAAVASAAVLSGALAPTATADCSQERDAHPARLRQPWRPPLTVGDSTMFFSIPLLASLGIEADAKVCRIFYTGDEILAARKRAGTLPPLSILALGANGDVFDGNISYAREIIGPDRVLGLVTPRNSAANAKVMRQAARDDPDRTILMDWAAFSAHRPSWFADDGLHVNLKGARAFAEFIRRKADPMMPPSAAHLRLPPSAAGTRGCGAGVFVIHGSRRITCAHARSIARRPVFARIPGWRAYAWGLVGHRSWSAVYRRADGRILLATRPDSP